MAVSELHFIQSAANALELGTGSWNWRTVFESAVFFCSISCRELSVKRSALLQPGPVSLPFPTLSERNFALFPLEMAMGCVELS